MNNLTKNLLKYGITALCAGGQIMGMNPVAIRELLDKGLMKAPVNQYYKDGEYSAIIDDVIATWHKDDYLKAVEARKATKQNHIAPEPKQKKVKDREER